MLWLASNVRSSHDFFALEYFNLGKREAMLPTSTAISDGTGSRNPIFGHAKSAERWVKAS